jgi:ribonuclease P protein component
LVGARLGLPKQSRLLKPGEFTATMKQGARIRDDLFSVFSVVNQGGPGRIGITVSRRVSLNAVIRNRIKRHVRESFRKNQDTLTGLDMVVIANNKAAAASADNIRAALGKIWEKTTRACKKS